MFCDSEGGGCLYGIDGIVSALQSMMDVMVKSETTELLNFQLVDMANAFMVVWGDYELYKTPKDPKTLCGVTLLSKTQFFLVDLPTLTVRQTFLFSKQAQEDNRQYSLCGY